MQGQDHLDGLRDQITKVESKLNELLASKAQLKDDAETLHALVKRGFEAKQALHRAQLKLMEKRVELLRSDIDRREALAEQIIEKRVKDLLRSEHKVSTDEADPVTVMTTPDIHPDDKHTDSGESPESVRVGDNKLVVFYLNHIKAEDAYHLLSDFLADRANIRLARDDRLNSLLIQANDEAMQQIQHFIQLIDVAVEVADSSASESMETVLSDDGALIKQYKVQGNRDMLIKGLIHLFRNSKSTQVGPTGEHRIVVVGNEKDQVRAQSWLEQSDAQVPYLVAIPSQSERLRSMKTLDERLALLRSEQAELTKRLGSRHPSQVRTLEQITRIERTKELLKEDYIRFNVFLGPGRKETIGEAIAAVPKKSRVEWRIHPRGHLEISGPREQVVEFGDALVDFLNRSASAEGASNDRILELIRDARDNLGREIHEMSASMKADLRNGDEERATATKRAIDSLQETYQEMEQKIEELERNFSETATLTAQERAQKVIGWLAGLPPNRIVDYLTVFQEQDQEFAAALLNQLPERLKKKVRLLIASHDSEQNSQ